MRSTTSRPSDTSRSSDNAIVFGGIGAFLVALLAIMSLLGVPFMEPDRPLVAGVPASVTAR